MSSNIMPILFVTTRRMKPTSIIKNGWGYVHLQEIVALYDGSDNNKQCIIINKHVLVGHNK